jgi:hypothetical protein
MHYCSRDLKAMNISASSGGKSKEIILGSAYFPYDDAVPHLPRSWRNW